MNTIMDIIHTYKELLTLGLVMLMFLPIFQRYGGEISFWLMDLLYGLPMVGKVARLSKNLEFNAQSGWFYSEEELARAYINHHGKLHADPEYYDKCSSYLARAGETGRRPFTWYMWALVFIMVAIEAMGFSYVLAGFTIPGASENILRLGSIGISILVSVLLVGFTHWSGKELYTNALLAKARSWWAHDSRDGAKLVESNHEVSIERNHADDGEAKYVQLLNRVSTTGDAERHFGITIGTAILVITIAIGATWVRGVVLERELQAETTGSMAQIGWGQAQLSFPKVLTAPQAEADKKSVAEAASLDRQGGWGTFIVLAVIFVFMQIFGVLTGYKFGFAGKESAKAYAIISRFNNRLAYEVAYRERKTAILRDGARRLVDLQQRLAKNVRERGTTSDQKEAMNSSQDRHIHAYLYREQGQADETDLREKQRLATKEAQWKQAQASASAPVKQPVFQSRTNTLAPDVADRFDETDEKMEARIRAEMDRETEEAHRRKADEHRAREVAMRARLAAEQSK